VTTLVHEMARRRGRYGLATMCVGVGQGVSTLFEGLAVDGHGR
jgi:acetyl-CoA acetyltransferase